MANYQIFFPTEKETKVVKLHKVDRAKLGLKTSLEDQILQISTVSDLRDAAKASRILQRQT